MIADSIEVSKIGVEYIEIDTDDNEIAEAMQQAFGTTDVRRLYPLIPARLTLELRGVSIAVARALQRVMVDELPGTRLEFSTGGYIMGRTTEPVMIEPFVAMRIQGIPLHPQIPQQIIQETRFSLYATNETTSTKDVYSGDLIQISGPSSTPLFSPTFKIAFLDPGRTLTIENIHITEGHGRQNASYNRSILDGYKYLDLEEYPKELTHSLPSFLDREGDASPQAPDMGTISLAASSGYKASSFKSNPRAHLMKFIIPQTPRDDDIVRSLAIDACVNIKDRLRYVQTILKAAVINETGPAYMRTQAQLVITPSGEKDMKAVLTVRGETDTIGNLLRRTIYEMGPINYVGYKCTKHLGEMQLTVVHDLDEEGLKNRIIEAVSQAWEIFDRIQQKVLTY